MKFAGWLILLFLYPLSLSSGKSAPKIGPIPPATRELRGVWVASVENIDWPSKPGLPVEKQKAELIKLLDTAVSLNLNTIIFQVRPACDALYKSDLEPWSEYLTGVMGKDPGYDPLEYIISEAHARGLELHVWINPYRARAATKRPASQNHVSFTHPDWVRNYGKFMWLDPGIPEVQDYTLSVVNDLVKRYDIDGVHIDDYFYPYPEHDEKKKAIQFPDDPSWKICEAKINNVTRSDWRRANVDSLIERMYKAIKHEKPWVKFGISPFGIWRPNFPAGTKGLDAYADLYADSRRWITNGWCDYFVPQLYYRIGTPHHGFISMLNWWMDQNKLNRTMCAGMYTGLAALEKNGWTTHEIPYQIKSQRDVGANGHIHFSMKSLTANFALTKSIRELNASPAVVPQQTWLAHKNLTAPSVIKDGNFASWAAADVSQISGWEWWTFKNGAWKMEWLPKDTERKEILSGDSFALASVDRYGSESNRVIIQKNSER